MYDIYIEVHPLSCAHFMHIMHITVSRFSDYLSATDAVRRTSDSDTCCWGELAGSLPSPVCGAAL